MKLNFWQWLGAIIFVLGAIFLIIHKSGERGEKNATPPARDVAPATSNVPATTMTSP
jgi:hypothetical protein